MTRLHLLFAEQFDGELRIFPCRAGLGFHFNHVCRHAGLEQYSPVVFAITQAADDDARRGVFLEKFRRAFRPFVRTAAQYHNHVGVHRPAVHAQKRLRKNNRGHDQQQQQNEKNKRGSFDWFFHARKNYTKRQASASEYAASSLRPDLIGTRRRRHTVRFHPLQGGEPFL